MVIAREGGLSSSGTESWRDVERTTSFQSAIQGAVSSQAAHANHGTKALSRSKIYSNGNSTPEQVWTWTMLPSVQVYLAAQANLCQGAHAQPDGLHVASGPLHCQVPHQFLRHLGAGTKCRAIITGLLQHAPSHLRSRLGLHDCCDTVR